MVQLIDLFVAAEETTRAGHLGVHDDCAQIVGIHRVVGEFCQADVAEALKGVGGFENVVAAAADIDVFVFGGAVVCRVEIAVAVKHFGVVHYNATAARRVDFQLNIACHVLTEVDNQLVLRRAEYRDGSDPLVLGDEFADLRDQFGLHIGGNRVSDLFNRRGQVNRLAHVDVGGKHGRGKDFPVGCGGNDLFASVRVGQGQFGNQGDVVGGVVIIATVADATDCPTLPDADGEAVLSRAEQIGDIVCLNLHAVLVGGPSGRQDGVPHARTVELCDVNADGRRGKRGFLQRLSRCGKGFFVAVCRHARVARGGDPGCRLQHIVSPFFRFICAELFRFGCYL